MTANWQTYYARRHESGADRARVMYLLWLQGYTLSAIGSAYGVTGDMVAKVLARYGHTVKVGVGRVRNS